MHNQKWLITILSFVTVFYCLMVLGYVSSLPDLRLRILLTSEQAETPIPVQGIMIRQSLINSITDTADTEYYVERPEAGDWLTEVAGFPTPTFTDYVHSLAKLRDLESRHISQMPVGGDPKEIDIDGSLGKIVEFIKDGQVINRVVRVKFWHEGWAEPHETWIVLKSLPLTPLILSTVWFLMQMGILGISILAYWHRPFDHSAKLFFLLSVCTTNAFIGGFHWWVVASNYWLLFIFLFNAILLPALTLHFFLTYPVPQSIVLQFPTISRIGIYALPTLAFTVMTWIIALCFLNSGSTNTVQVNTVNALLVRLNELIYIYLGIGFIYFSLSIVSLSASVARTRNPIERQQVTWILRAALGAVPLLIYTFYLALFRQVDFAFGQAAIPMFLVSALFLIAYAVGVMRFRMLMLDHFLSRNIVSYFVEYCVALLVSLAISWVFLYGFLKGKSAPERVFPFTIFLVLVNLVMLWIRDRMQHLIQHQFSREKYPLEQTLQQLQLPPGESLKPQLIADRMLTSCREGLRVEQAALYLSSESGRDFQLVSAYGNNHFPRTYRPPQALVDSLRHGTSLQRTNPGSRSALSPVQRALRELDCWLVHALELNNQIVGLVVLGQKKMSEPFTAEDVSILHSLSQVTGIAVHCAMIQQQITVLHEELRGKTDQVEDQRRQISLLQNQLKMPIEIQGQPANATLITSPSFIRSAIIGNSPAMQQVLSIVEKIAASQASVMLRGESGTGKELFARAIHQNSPRRDGPLVSVHCAALSPSLLESELFGHVKGAFTGANQDRVGRFALAHGGTLFLDEIGDISPETQVKLLRVLQERCFEPVGSHQSVQVDVRLIAATHQNLEKLIQEGKFREDLFYRLNVITLQLPSLRDRKEDILPLAGYFLDRASIRTGKLISRFGNSALQALEEYPWPGNIRELENAIERAVVLTDGDELELGHFPPEIRHAFDVHQAHLAANPTPTGSIKKVASMFEKSLSSTPRTTNLPTGSSSYTPPTSPDQSGRFTNLGTAKPISSREKKKSEERESIITALAESGGNKAEAARKLGIPRSTLFSKLKKHHLD